MALLRTAPRSDVNQPIKRTPPPRVPSCAVAPHPLPSRSFLSREPRSSARFINARRGASGDMRESRSYSPRERHAREKYYVYPVNLHTMASAAYEKYTDRASNFLTRIAHPVIDDPASPEGKEEEERRGGVKRSLIYVMRLRNRDRSLLRTKNASAKYSPMIPLEQCLLSIIIVKEAT